jgi:hypothetical protein
MALVVYDRVQQTGTANTTVSFTLSATTTGYQSFAVIGNGNTTYYSANDGTNWEVGLGTYATGGTLTRTTVLASSNSGSAVTFSGTVTVFCDYLAGRAVYQDTTLTANAPQFSATNGIFVNNKTIATSYSIPSGYAASSVGPVSISSGQSVTVPSGSRWVVL